VVSVSRRVRQRGIKYEGNIQGIYCNGHCFLTSLVVDAQLYRGEKLVEDWKAYKTMLVPKALKSPALVQRMGNYVGYVAGVYDPNYDIFALPTEVAVDQLCNAVGKYLDEHQNELHEPAINLAPRGFTAMVSREVPPKKK
jgi:Rap1a immunity proteins